MIARVWTGVVATARVDDYVDYVRDTGVAAYARTDGCRVATTLVRSLDNGRSEVVAFSVWESRAHLQAFTGNDIDAMVLYPEDQQFLLEAPTLVHHEVRSFHPADRTPS
jgi:heme-degrading monooxygenase HmoA